MKVLDFGVMGEGQVRFRARCRPIIYHNKAISMMRGKSPLSDVEVSKKLNFVAAILDFWRPFLNQF